MAITRFHNLVHILQRQHNEPEWFSISSMWWPDHTQYFPGDPLRRFLCTEATNHNPPRGLILYDVRQPPRQRRQRPSRQLDLVAVDPAFIQLTGDLRAELPKKIRFFDPDAPNHVIIAPREVAWMFYQQYNETLKDKHMRVKPSYDFPGGRAVKDMRARLHFVSKVLGVVSAVIIIVGASVVLIHVAAVGATVGTGAMVGTGTTVGTGATVGPTSTIVAPAAIAGKVVSATGAAVTATEMAAYAALLSAPTVKTVAATAGVLMIVGFTKTAKAAGPKSTQATQPTIERVLAIRAIPIGDFKPIGGIQSASSAGPPLDFAHTPDTSRGKFNLGTEVLFDNLPHVIIGQLAVR